MKNADLTNDQLDTLDEMLTTETKLEELHAERTDTVLKSHFRPFGDDGYLCEFHGFGDIPATMRYEREPINGRSRKPLYACDACVKAMDE